MKRTTLQTFAFEILIGKPGYEWTLNHVMPVADAAEVFRTETALVKGAAASKAA